MIQIKKTILTLVALLAVTTGAWAEGTVTLTEIKASEMPTSWEDNNNPAKATDLPGFTAVTRDEAKALGAPAAEGDIYVIYAISNDDFIGLIWNNGVLSDNDGVCSLGAIYAFKDVFKFYYTGSAASAVEVAWNKTSKTGTFKMPGGNVELEPEYYPQAALTAQPTAINDVPATTDGAIVKAGTVANIGSTTTAQGTVMYYVSPTALDDAALLALAADAWTAAVPTAESLAQGQAYVYYYVRGNDGDTDEENFSDGDIKAANALTVTIAAAPTYAVTFADGLAEPTLWTASPNTDVTKGQTVTVTYTGSKKVLGVKAEKKAAKTPATVTTAPTATTGDIVAGSETALVSGVAATGGTMMYKVTTTNTQPTTTDGFSATVPTAEGLTAGTYYVWYYVKADDSHTDSEISATAIAVTVKAATVLSGALVDGATIKVNFKWREQNAGDYVQGVYSAASGTFTASKGGNDWASEGVAVYKVEKSGDNIIIGAGLFDYTTEAMVWTFNTTNDTYTTMNGDIVNRHPKRYGLISVTLNGTNITSQLTAQ